MGIQQSARGDMAGVQSDTVGMQCSYNRDAMGRAEETQQGYKGDAIRL